MPGAYPRTSTFALTNATLPYLVKLANKGFNQIVKDDAGFAKGVNTYKGYLTYKPVAEALGVESSFQGFERDGLDFI